MPLLRVLGDFLLSPAERLVDPLERSTARLLAACLLAMVLVFGLLDSVNVSLNNDYEPPWQGYVLLAGAYLLSRGRHFRVAAVIASLMFPIVTISEVALHTQGETNPLSFAMLAPFFGGMFLGTRAALAIAAVSLSGILLLPLASSGRVSTESLVDPFVANLLAGVIAVAYSIRRDWLEKRRREELHTQQVQLLQMQKMEAIGRMAGGIAHDFNNQLTVIAGGIELLSRNGASKELKLIDAATNSARNLTAQLLTLSRQGVVAHASTHLPKLLQGMAQLLNRIIGEDVTLRLLIAPDVQYVRLEESQLQQILLNLVTNARDAMPEGGTLTISAESGSVERVFLVVSDTGCGMDERTRQRIFEPFFTTKSVGKGTGLGLSMVFGLVSQAGGNVRVESSLGQGSSFRLELPAASRPQEKPAQSSERYLSFRGAAKGCILLVEDDAGVRDLSRSVLRREGYEVIEASDPREALELFSESKQRIELVISDVVMPHMTGPQMIEALRDELGDVPVLYISGYAPETLGQEVDARTLLRKPFRPTDLLRRVSGLLYGLDSQAPPTVENVELPAIPGNTKVASELLSSSGIEAPVSSAPAESGARLVKEQRGSQSREQEQASSGVTNVEIADQEETQVSNRGDKRRG